MSENGLNGKGNGAAKDEVARKRDEVVADLAASCARFVERRYGVALDYEPDTLSLLDQYVRDARAGAIDEATKAETVELVVAVTGAYFGEVARRAYGAEWVAEGPYEEWKLCLEPVYLAFNPLGVMREAFRAEEQPGWNAHLAMEEADRPFVEARIAALGEVDADEFFLPSTRWDVLEIAVEALKSRMNERGETGVRFSREDY
jgi:hypothetical protein